MIACLTATLPQQVVEFQKASGLHVEMKQGFWVGLARETSLTAQDVLLAMLVQAIRPLVNINKSFFSMCLNCINGA